MADDLQAQIDNILADYETQLGEDESSDDASDDGKDWHKRVPPYCGDAKFTELSVLALEEMSELVAMKTMTESKLGWMYAVARRISALW
jgi:hypothetical protein